MSHYSGRVAVKKDLRSHPAPIFEKIQMIFGGTLGTIVHKVEEFASFPWHKLDPERCAYDWSFGFGGHGLESWQMTISYPEDEKGDVWHIWVIPQPLAAMVKIASNSAVEEARRKIRIAMGID